MKKLSLSLILILPLLFACDVDREPPRPGPYGELESVRMISRKNETIVIVL